MKVLLASSLIFFTLCCFTAYAKEKNGTPTIDYAKGQFAGEIGFLSVGAGVRFASWYELTAMYGFVLAFLDVDDIHTIALKNDFSFYRPSSIMRLYFNASLLIVLGKKYWPAFYRDDMKAWYYYNSGAEGIFSLGFEYMLPKKWGMGNIGIYTEYGILAQWLYFYVDNYGDVPFFDTTTLTFGVNYNF